MFSIFKKRSNDIDLSDLGTDMHSHLIPGIDDGSDNVESSIVLIKGLMELGYTRLITTPHIIWDMYRNDPTIIGAGHRTLQAGLQEHELDITTRAAAEYYMDEYFEGLVNEDAPLLTIKDTMILVEISFSSAPINFKEVIFNLQMKGYQPVLAHPERYLYFAGNKTMYDDLKDMGILFQMNILSVAGYYGKTAMELAHHLIKKEYIDLIGTDLHHYRHLEVLRTSHHIMGPVKALLDSGKIINSSL
jgi:tyrosine-protein phosphatase YwqE